MLDTTALGFFHGAGSQWFAGALGGGGGGALGGCIQGGGMAGCT